jgi:hypothetical protein
MRFTRAMALIAMFVATASALALPAIRSEFTKRYKSPSAGAQAKAGCALCHVGNTLKRNAYGADLEKALKASGSSRVTAAVFAKIEKLDSDRDGTKNGVECTKGTLPGDPKSK